MAVAKPASGRVMESRITHVRAAAIKTPRTKTTILIVVARSARATASFESRTAAFAAVTASAAGPMASFAARTAASAGLTALSAVSNAVFRAVSASLRSS